MDNHTQNGNDASAPPSPTTSTTTPEAVYRKNAVNAESDELNDDVVNDDTPEEPQQQQQQPQQQLPQQQSPAMTPVMTPQLSPRSRALSKQPQINNNNNNNHSLNNNTLSPTLSPSSTWGEVFLHAGLSSSIAASYADIFEHHEMPPPGVQTFVLVDDAMLVSVGITAPGHKAKILQTIARIAREFNESRVSGRDSTGGGSVGGGAAGNMFLGDTSNVWSLASPSPAHTTASTQRPSASHRSRRFLHNREDLDTAMNNYAHVSPMASARRSATPLGSSSVSGTNADFALQSARVVTVTERSGPEHSGCVRWVDISGVDTTFNSTVESMARKYNLHPAFVKDCHQPLALPQFDHFENSFFMVMRVASENYDPAADTQAEVTHKWMFFSRPETNFLLTIHRVDYPCFAKRRTMYANLDTPVMPVVDFLTDLLYAGLHTYAEALRFCEATLDQYEARLLDESESNSKTGKSPLVTKLYHLHRRVSVYQRTLEMILASVREMQHCGVSCSADGPNPDSQDLEDAVIALITKAKVLHESCQNLLNLHLALLSNYTNELMTVLTVFSVFFYSADVHYWGVRYEFYQYAGAEVEVWISNVIRNHAGNGCDHFYIF
eukprot:PhM_4_TR17996/c0_g1_i1/m.23966/K03284/corA; magnesium transporter